jgi:hypothetical protein
LRAPLRLLQESSLEELRVGPHQRLASCQR